VHHAVGVDAEQVAVVGEVVDGAQREAVAHGGDALGLCVGQRDLVEERDVEQALFGPEVISVPVNEHGPAGDARLSRDPQGFWQRGDHKRATRVSAVLSTIHLHSWSAGVVPLQLWHNPWAALPLSVKLPWAATVPDLAFYQLVRSEAAVAPAELLGLDRVTAGQSQASRPNRTDGGSAAWRDP